MSDGMNKVILLGNLGANPELRYTPAGVAVLNMRLATNETWRDKNKELQERTEWHTVVVFGNRAEGLARVLGKGASLLIEGGLRTTSYEKDGQTRYKTEVHAREVLFAGRRNAPPRHVLDDGGYASRPPAQGLADGAPSPAFHDASPGALDDGVRPAVPSGGGGDDDPFGRAGAFAAAKRPANPLDDLPY